MGGSEVEIVTVAQAPIAVRAGTTTRDELSKTIREYLDTVWKFIRERGDLEPGHNVVVYRGDPSAGPAPIEAGVQVGKTFNGATPSGVWCSRLPAGRAARIVHRGPYDQMAASNQALRKWIDDGGHVVKGPSWEVYGDWNDDPSQLETEIYYLLED